MQGQLIAHFKPFFQLTARTFTFRNKKTRGFDVSRQNRVVFDCFGIKACLIIIVI